jgi:hypothetical protein
MNQEDKPVETPAPNTSSESGNATPSKGIQFYGGYQVYSESGIDLTLLQHNLEFTETQRLERGLRSSSFAAAVTRAGRSRMREESAHHQGASMSLDLESILKELDTHRVRYVLIGGQAMLVRGSASITFDLDICYERTPQNIAALSSALAPHHPYLRGAPPGLLFHFDVPTIQAGLNFTLQTDWGDVDVLGEVSGVGVYEQALAQSEVEQLFGVSVSVLSLGGLIAAKKAVGRIKDRLHILELEELKKIREASGEPHHDQV